MICDFLYFTLLIAKYHLADITIIFNQSTNYINENDGTVKLVLVLSNPSSTAITVQITDSELTATSK